MDFRNNLPILKPMYNGRVNFQAAGGERMANTNSPSGIIVVLANEIIEIPKDSYFYGLRCFTPCPESWWRSDYRISRSHEI